MGPVLDCQEQQPGDGATLPQGNVVSIEGTVSDPQMVAKVWLSIFDLVQQSWWDGNDWVQSNEEICFEATLDSPTESFYVFNEPASSGSGSYAVTATAEDVGGNLDPDPAGVAFYVT